ncbi:MAG: hypothetical protein GY862_03245 [Gammaproteobacteria bacterium]|nr:hypothetical protein [Gammaproteobacteria bacterium]
MKHNFHLPQTWALATLGDVLVRVQDRIIPQSHKDKNFFYVGLENIESGTGRLVEVSTQSGENILSQKTVFKSGDILYGKLRPYLNKAHLAERTGICSTDIWALRAIPGLSAQYLHYYLRSPFVVKRASQSTTGANLPRLDAQVFDKMPIPIPSAPEQQRIVEILRQAEELHQLRACHIRELQKIPLSLFLKLFGDPLSNPFEFKKHPLEKLGTVDRGISKHRPRDAAFLFNGPYPFIQTGDVTNSGGWIKYFTQSYSKEGLAQSKLWPEGTLCITIAANIAKTGILTFDACFPDNVVGFIPREQTTAEYIMHSINVYQTQLETQAPQAAQKNINLKALRDLLIPLPPKSLQDNFSQRVHEIRSLIEKQTQALQELENLIITLQSQGFTGNLTANWRKARLPELKKTAKACDQAFKLKQPTQDEQTEDKKESSRLAKHRPWLYKQLSKLQQAVLKNLHAWETKIFLPAQELDSFSDARPAKFSRQDHDAIRRALNQLAGLGLIACVSVRDQDTAEYVTAYRLLREDEFTRLRDIETLRA